MVRLVSWYGDACFFVTDRFPSQIRIKQSPYKELVVQNFWCSLFATLNDLLRKQWTCKRFDKSWRWFDVIVICCVLLTYCFVTVYTNGSVNIIEWAIWNNGLSEIDPSSDENDSFVRLMYLYPITQCMNLNLSKTCRNRRTTVNVRPYIASVKFSYTLEVVIYVDFLSMKQSGYYWNDYWSCTR